MLLVVTCACKNWPVTRANKSSVKILLSIKNGLCSAAKKGINSVRNAAKY